MIVNDHISDPETESMTANPAYAAISNSQEWSATQTAPHPVPHTAPVSAEGGGISSISTSVREREFDNPLYSGDPTSNDGASEDPYTTVPDSPPPQNIYERVADENLPPLGVGAEPNPNGRVSVDHNTAVYYSTIKT